jgi:anti-sigma factor RsiW
MSGIELHNHISDHDLERYYLGMVREEAELAPLEEHLLACPDCVERAEEIQNYVNVLRIALDATERC